jgi:hypothetical protein
VSLPAQQRDLRQQLRLLVDTAPRNTAQLSAALAAYSEQIVLDYHRDAPGAELAELLPAQMKDLHQLRQAFAAAFADDWSALVYCFTGGALRIICLTPADLLVEVLADDRALQGLIAQASLPSYRSYTYADLPLEQGLTQRPWQRLEDLADRLLPASVRARLHPAHRLLIVPAGALHSLPWAALRLSGGWLVERAIIHLLPSLTVGQALVGRRPAGAGLLLAGCSSFGERAAPLPGVGRELAMIAALWQGPQRTIRDADATPAALLAACAEAGERLALLHIASHALQLPSHGRAAHLKLWDDDLLLPEIVRMGLAGASVVLSACDGAAADVLPGEELLSLSWAFLAAGASGVLASLWPLPDHALPELMRAIYTQLAGGSDLALALALAQRALIARPADAELHAPQIWGALLVTGGHGP